MSHASHRHADSGPEPVIDVIYTEDRCALRWPTLFYGTIVPALAVALFILGSLHQNAGIWVLDLFLLLVGGIGGLLLWSNWPTGIRMDTRGIHFGGMRRAERRARRGARPRRRVPEVATQRYQVFSCPWPGVQSLSLVTDPADLRSIRKQTRKWGRQTAGTQVPLGYFQAPFMRACLIIRHAPAIGLDAQFRHSWAGAGIKADPKPSRTWLVPTRHPEALRAALARVPGCPPVGDHLDAPIQF